MANKKIKKEKGIALIVTIMLSAIMLTTVFVASREMIDEAKNSTRVDNSLIAYYAAEAGLEDALIQYRFNKDAEILKCVNLDNDNNSNGGSFTTGCDDLWVPRNGEFYIANSNRNAYIERFYKVKMWYKAKSFDDSIVLNKDDVLEISLPENSGFTFDWKEEGVSLGGGNRMLVEFTTYNKTSGSIIEKKYVDPKKDPMTFTSDNGPDKSVRIRPWLVNDSTGTMIEGNAISGETPRIIISNIKSSGSGNFGGPVTYIQSIGYYGGVQRKIVANVNRMSGQVMNIMDFVIYSGSDIVK